MTDTLKKKLFEMEKRAMNFAQIAYQSDNYVSTILTKSNYEQSKYSRIFRTYYFEFQKNEMDRLNEYKRENNFRFRSPDQMNKDESGRFYLSSLSKHLKILSYDEIMNAIQIDGFSRLGLKSDVISSFEVGHKTSRLYAGYKNILDPESLVFILLIGEVIGIVN